MVRLCSARELCFCSLGGMSLLPGRVTGLGIQEFISMPIMHQVLARLSMISLHKALTSQGAKLY